jgi:FimV-like protein
VSEPDQDDWGLDTPPASAAAVTKQRPAAQALDVGDQGVATKMELARAYIDIGDAEGARGMLEEVLMEGNDSQRADALKLLETLD